MQTKTGKPKPNKYCKVKIRCMIQYVSYMYCTYHNHTYQTLHIIHINNKIHKSLIWLHIIINMYNVLFIYTLFYVLWHDRINTYIWYISYDNIQYLTKWTKILIYETKIAPHYEYCSSIFLSANEKDIIRLQ
jgi:hypothetical protein